MKHMYNFFVDSSFCDGEYYRISGGDYNHIVNVLRMKPGDELLLSDMGQSDLCVIEDISSGEVIIKVISQGYKNAELPIKIILFQGLPKSDKMEFIIQKSVELGVSEIVPVEMKRCVLRLDDKKKKSRLERWQNISRSAAEQSKRGIIPHVHEILSYEQMLKKAEKLDLFIIPYENERGTAATLDTLKKIKRGMNVGILIGPEGGFEPKEIEKAILSGGLTVSLGERILRTETAAVTAVSMCMLYTEMKLGDEQNG